MSTPEHSWALMSTHEHLWVLRRTQEHSIVCCCGANEDSRHHGAVIPTTHENWRLPISAHSCSWVLLVPWFHTHECSWSFISTCGHSLAILSTHEYSWAFICSLFNVLVQCGWSIWPTIYNLAARTLQLRAQDDIHNQKKFNLFLPKVAKLSYL